MIPPRNILKRSSPPPPAPSRPNTPVNQSPTLMSTLASGIALGTGSSLGHRVMDAVMGPRQIEVSQPNQPPPENDICKPLKEKYLMCLDHNISNCNDLHDLMIRFNCK